MALGGGAPGAAPATVAPAFAATAATAAVVPATVPTAALAAAAAPATAAATTGVAALAPSTVAGAMGRAAETAPPLPTPGGAGSPPPAKRRRASPPTTPNPPALAPPAQRAPPPGRKAHGSDLPTASLRDYVTTTCGRRLVLPYPHTWVLNAKARWRGRALGEVLSAELHRPQPSVGGVGKGTTGPDKPAGAGAGAGAAVVDATADYWAREVASGRLLRNGAPTTVDAVVVNGDVLTHATHRHESSAGASPPPHLLAVTPTLTAWAKPPGVPVHPCGTYRRAALTHLLAAGGWTVAPTVAPHDVAAVAAAAAVPGMGATWPPRCGSSPPPRRH